MRGCARHASGRFHCKMQALEEEEVEEEETNLAAGTAEISYRVEEDRVGAERAGRRI